MSFVRPEARAAIWRWREVLGGGVALALGVYWIAGGFGLLFWVGWVVAMLGAMGIAIGLPRGRFRSDSGGGPGVVQVVEGQVSYFGPLTGGIVDLDAVETLVHDATGYPAHWRLTAPGAPPIHIPVTARGAEALFDAFQALPGLQTTALLEARKARDGTRIVWRRPH